LNTIIGGSIGGVVFTLGGLGIAYKFNLCQQLNCVSCCNKTYIVEGGHGRKVRTATGGGGGGSGGEEQGGEVAGEDEKV
jgi:hypothetical protein